MADKLTKMLEFQKKFQGLLYQGYNPKNLDYPSKVELTKKYCLYLHEEISEIMQSLRYKEHHVYDKKYNIDDTREEIIDCLKFVLNLGILWEMSPNDFQRIFNKKSKVNLQRIKK